MPVFRALSKDQKRGNVTDGAQKQKPPGTIAIEQRANLNTKKKVERDLGRRYPAHVLGRVVGELVTLPVSLEKTDGGGKPKSGGDDSE